MQQRSGRSYRRAYSSPPSCTLPAMVIRLELLGRVVLELTLNRSHDEHDPGPSTSSDLTLGFTPEFFERRDAANTPPLSVSPPGGLGSDDRS